MATLDYRTTCELNRPVTIKHLDGMFFSQDVQANRIVVSVVRGGVNENLSGSVSANIIRADGATVVQTGEVSGNVATVTLPAAAYAVPGAIAVFVKHTGSGVTSTIAAVTGYVYKSTTDTIVDPGTVVPNINELLAMIDDCEDATAACIAATAAAPVIDDTAGAGATNKVWSAQKTNTEVSQLKSDVKAIQGLSEDIKQALLECFQHVAWIDSDGQDYYDALEGALYPPVTLESISAVYTQSGTVYDNASLNDLKTDLVVTAHYNDSTTGIVTNYVLSGTLTAGTSTVTVSYGGKTTTFTVTVTAVPTITSITATYSPDIVYAWDALDILKDDLTVKAVYSDASETEISAANYSLSGTLAAGTCTITVTYQTFTTTFTVIVYGFVFTNGYLNGYLENDSQPRKAQIKQNTARIICDSPVGDTPLNDTDGNATVFYPVPIRAGITRIYTDYPNGYRRSIVILAWSESKNDFVQVYGTGWSNTHDHIVIDEQYRDGSYYIGATFSGANGSEDMTNVDTSDWEVTLYTPAQ